MKTAINIESYNKDTGLIKEVFDKAMSGLSANNADMTAEMLVPDSDKSSSLQQPIKHNRPRDV